MDGHDDRQGLVRRGLFGKEEIEGLPGVGIGGVGEILEELDAWRQGEAGALAWRTLRDGGLSKKRSEQRGAE
jgi:hypothetical protein